MPRRIPAETKREAIEILQICDDISVAHYLTGVHRRTLRRWRQELIERDDNFMSEKNIVSDIGMSNKLRKSRKSAVKRPSRRRAQLRVRRRR